MYLSHICKNCRLLNICHCFYINAQTWGVLVLLICVQILVCIDCFSQSITMEV